MLNSTALYELVFKQKHVRVIKIKKYSSELHESRERGMSKCILVLKVKTPGATHIHIREGIPK